MVGAPAEGRVGVVPAAAFQQQAADVAEQGRIGGGCGPGQQLDRQFPLPILEGLYAKGDQQAWVDLVGFGLRPPESVEHRGVSPLQTVIGHHNGTLQYGRRDRPW
ncbi:hypothetical protein Abr02nite_44960 [Paractinoplanes brasiliensis]|nr:hypothetical protein Abr02nite_44960 [Actinoplanes brasiliensis]